MGILLKWLMRVPVITIWFDIIAQSLKWLMRVPITTYGVPYYGSEFTAHPCKCVYMFPVFWEPYFRPATTASSRCLVLGLKRLSCYVASSAGEMFDDGVQGGGVRKTAWGT